MKEYPDDPYAEAWELETLDVEFELLNSADGRTITLVCSLGAEETQEIHPHDYAQALRQFADRIDALTTLADADMEVVN